MWNSVGKKSFLVYYDFEEQTAALTDAQVGRVIRMILAYERRGELVEETDPAIQMAFSFLRPSLDSNRRKYDAMCARNRRNRGVAEDLSPLVTSGTDQEKEKDTVQEEKGDREVLRRLEQSKEIWSRYQRECDAMRRS